MVKFVADQVVVSEMPYISSFYCSSYFFCLFGILFDLIMSLEDGELIFLQITSQFLKKEHGGADLFPRY